MKENIKKYFNPNITPRQIFSLGSFGGTYWREIKHKGVLLKNQHLKYQWNLPEEKTTKKWSEYDKNINRYKVKVGSTLAEWRMKGWINDQDPYGWVSMVLQL